MADIKDSMNFARLLRILPMNDHAKLTDAFNAEPKPVTAERLLAIAKENLDGPKYQQFAAWFTACGNDVVARLNG